MVGKIYMTGRRWRRLGAVAGGGAELQQGQEEDASCSRSKQERYHETPGAAEGEQQEKEDGVSFSRRAGGGG